MNRTMLAVRMVFADHGSFHDLVVQLPADVLERYERLVDALREDPEITAGIFVDHRRLIAAYVEDSPGPAGAA